jgi:hypothetical protein
MFMHVEIVVQNINSLIWLMQWHELLSEIRSLWEERKVIFFTYSNTKPNRKPNTNFKMGDFLISCDTFSPKVSQLIIPWCTYTQPEIAHVGSYENDLIKAGLKIQTFRVDFKVMCCDPFTR